MPFRRAPLSICIYAKEYMNPGRTWLRAKVFKGFTRGNLGQHVNSKEYIKYFY